MKTKTSSTLKQKTELPIVPRIWAKAAGLLKGKKNEIEQHISEIRSDWDENKKQL